MIVCDRLNCEKWPTRYSDKYGHICDDCWIKLLTIYRLTRTFTEEDKLISTFIQSDVSNLHECENHLNEIFTR